MNLPGGVTYHAGKNGLIAKDESAIIQVDSGLGYNLKDRKFDENIEKYFSDDYSKFDKKYQLIRRHPAYSGAEHKRLPNITVIPNLKSQCGLTVFGSSMGHHQDENKEPKNQEIYEFETYGAFLIDRDGKGTVELWIAKDGDKIVVPNHCHMTLYNLDDKPLITLDFANPDENKSNKDLIKELGPILFGYYKEDEEAIFILNKAYVNDSKRRAGIVIEPPDNLEVHIPLKSGVGLAEQLYEALTSEEIREQFKRLGILIRKASPDVSVGGMRVKNPLWSESRKGSGLYEYFLSGTPRMTAIGVPASNPTLPAELMDIPQPIYQPNLITVRTLYTGVCATDASYLTAESDPRTDESRLSPTVAFHEVVGEVVHSGREALAIPEGTTVVPLVRRCQERMPTGIFAPCRFMGSCSQAGRPDRCPRKSKYLSRGTGKNSGFGSQFWTDEGMLLVQVPDDVLQKLRDDKYLCVLVEPMSISQKAVRLAHNLRRALVDEPNPYLDNVLVVGLGPIGLLTVFVLREQFGYRRVYGADVFPEGKIRAQILQELEGQYIKVEPEQENFYTSWIDANIERLGEANEGRFQIIIEATGIPAVVSSLIPALSPDGVIVVLGIPEGDAPFNIPGKELSALVSQNKVLSGCVNASKEDLVSGLWCIADCYERYPNAVKKLIGRKGHYTDYDTSWLQQHLNNRATEIKAILEW